MESMIKAEDERYDNLAVAVKTVSSEELSRYYLIFQWEQIDSYDDVRYDDVKHISYRRKHRLPNKDRLQYLQVCMEAEFNNMGKYKRNKNARETAIGLCVGLGGSGLLTVGILLIVFLLSVPAIICGAALAVLGVGVLIVLYPLIKSTKKREENRFIRLKSESKRKIDLICQEVKAMMAAY